MTRFLSALLLASGCTSTFDVNFAQIGLTDEQKSSATWAGDEWCERTGGDCCPTLDGTNVLTVEDVPETRAPRWGNTHVDPNDGTLRISIAPRVTDLGKFYRIVRHEMGHACRAMNRSAKESTEHLTEWNVMAFADDIQPAEITDADVEYAREP